MKFSNYDFQVIYFSLLIEKNIFCIFLIYPLTQHDTLSCEILYFRRRNIFYSKFKILFVKWFCISIIHFYLSILTCKFEEVRILNVTSPNTFQNHRNETACTISFRSPSYANQMRAQSLDYVLSPQCISTATQIQITFCVFPKNLFHICLHLPPYLWFSAHNRWWRPSSSFDWRILVDLINISSILIPVCLLSTFNVSKFEPMRICGAVWLFRGVAKVESEMIRFQQYLKI